MPDRPPLGRSSFPIRDPASIRRARLERGMTQGDVAAFVGVSRSAVAHWEIGTNTGVTVQYAYRLASALAVEFTSLFVTEGSPDDR